MMKDTKPSGHERRSISRVRDASPLTRIDVPPPGAPEQSADPLNWLLTIALVAMWWQGLPGSERWQTLGVMLVLVIGSRWRRRRR